MRLPQVSSKIDAIGRYFTETYREPLSTRIFFRVLVGCVFIKLLLIWTESRTMLSYHTISLPRSLFGKLILAPAFLADYDTDLFYLLSIASVVVIFFSTSFYASRFVFFWLNFNLFVVNLPLGDGSDLVLFMLSLWSIPMATRPAMRSGRMEMVQRVLYNLSLVFVQLQVVLIYFISGWDKVLSDTWRSGQAFAYIRHLERLYNPILPSHFDHVFWDVTFSWITIIFELLFVILIWTKRCRIPMLLAGFVFHLFIWIVLSLPDFAFIMIASLFIFAKDKDYYSQPITHDSNS